MHLAPQQKKVLRLLVSGPVKNYEFHRAYVMNYTARLSELGDMGFTAKAKHVKRGVFKYELSGADRERARKVLGGG